MQNNGFKKVDTFNENEKLVLYYENKSAKPVIIKESSIPFAVMHTFGDAIITDMLDRFICNTFGCFLNRMNPDYDWIRKELISLQMNGEEVGVVEFKEME